MPMFSMGNQDIAGVKSSICNIFIGRRNLRRKMHEKLQNATEDSWLQIALQFARTSGWKIEELGGVPAQYGDLLVVAERGGRENQIHRMQFPRDREVSSQDDLAGADLGGQVAQGFRRENQGIE